MIDKKEIIKKLAIRKNWPAPFEKGGKMYFIKKEDEDFVKNSNDALVNRIKLLLKKTPFIFSIVFHLVGLSFLGRSPKKVIENIKKGSIILNLGSGVTVVRDDVINIDAHPFENVDIVADIADLPFENETVDALISEHVLEHIPDPEKVVSEMHRILKPGGIVYVVVPFVMGFHSSPHDYYRWSEKGLLEQFGDFEKIESGMRSGPGAAVNYVLAEYVATLLSFSSVKLQQILFMMFMAIFAPLCWIDYLIYWFPSSKNIAHCVYYVGRKK